MNSRPLRSARVLQCGVLSDSACWPVIRYMERVVAFVSRQYSGRNKSAAGWVSRGFACFAHLPPSIAIQEAVAYNRIRMAIRRTIGQSDAIFELLWSDVRSGSGRSLGTFERSGMQSVAAPLRSWDHVWRQC